MKKNVFKVYLKNILLPCFLFSMVTGILTGVIVVFYKYLANEIIDFSSVTYSFLRTNPVYLPLAIAFVILVAFGLSFVYRYAPDSKGGGISNAIAYVRGLVDFKWLRTLLFVLINSFFTFFIGTPLGNEGPCVLAGATVGRGVMNTVGKKNKAWDRYVMTGGACAGFAAATGAPITGLLFSIEEAHHRLSPMILMVAGIAVSFAVSTSNLLSGLLGMNPNLFSSLAPITLQLRELWIPLLVGLFCGIFSVAFVKFFKLIRGAINKKVHIKHGRTLIIILIFIFTVIFGLFSSEFIGTGHHLIEHLLITHKNAIITLILILAIRFILTISGASAGITGGMFIPTLTFGAVVSAILAECLIALNITTQAYYQVIILLGMTACFSGMTKTPLTAIVFALEALSLSSNVLGVTIAAIIPFIISEIFCPKSANDEIMEIRVEEEQQGKTADLVDAVVVVQNNAFVVGKQIRDIFWPNNLFVLSIKQSDSRPHVDEHGEKNMYPGDVLHVRYSTFNKTQTHDELIALVGEQDYEENKWEE